MASRCSVYGTPSQPGTSDREGDKSVKLYPDHQLTFNQVQTGRGSDKLKPRSAGYHYSGRNIHRPENPQLFDQLGVFALWASESNILIISLFFQ